MPSTKPSCRCQIELAVLAALLMPLSAAPAAGPRDVRGQETLVPADDPVYRLLGALAARGWIPNAAARQFVGDPPADLTRKQIVDFLVPVARELAGQEPAPRYDALHGEDAARLLWALQSFAPELEARGYPFGPLADRLREHGAGGSAWLATGLAQGRLQNSGQALTGRLEGTLLGRPGERLRAGILAATRDREPFPDGRDRDNLPALFVEADLSRHATLRAGRMDTRFDPGHYSLIWSARARPLDGLYFTFRTKLLGRPLSYEQQTGYLRDGGRDKYITVQNYEYLPTRQWTVAAHTALMTNNFAQALSSFFVPVYLAPPHPGIGSGSRGNLLASFHASYRPSREIALYGQYLIDDFTLHRQPSGRQPQHTGWLGGLHYTPAGSLPGTDYRLEGGFLRDPNTYLSFTAQGLNWTRNGMFLGHPYGGDSEGFRFTGRQRLDRRWTLATRFEAVRQSRKTPPTVSTRSFDLSVRFDPQPFWSVGAGFRSLDVHNPGRVAGARQTEDILYAEASAAY